MAHIDDLKSTGLKATSPRLKILAYFHAGRQRHMSAEDVYRLVVQERADIGLATIYRVLTQVEHAAAASSNRAKRFTNSTKATTTITWCAWTADGSRSFLMPKSSRCKTMWQRPRAFASQTTP